ncbi:NAD(P)-dependent dehydrogenase (short-subunit alcohol dehydrogenase family) [Nocardioides daedukensis]|uniref:NAD(P)-dependent dehydrogenase (Short-subunit alcohol dehydrogenase family) n=1 Tax=Nocardioides daedukensis TaxID=634462 RepID=A0A7Y9S533_9ACTN|nr:SDR family oxidoreductase [Nocardioides daedukensis]NYG59570.1 NAD(P)-dependent dehydrogenase (short-subunit alcohol dehydrogenase family) [Nocardioides daedukensis]
MTSTLSGKVALVTGATRGLGRAIAEGLAREGVKVVVSSRKPEACAAVAAEITELTGARTMALPLHVGRWDDIAPAVARIESELGPLDILVNNAGIAPLAPDPLELTEALYDKTMEVNLKGPFRLMAVVGAQMARTGGGSIINISSIGSQRPSAGEATYSAAKAGLNALTQAFAQAYAPEVRVNCVMPGAFATDMSSGWDDHFIGLVTDGLPAGRLGVPKELVGMVAHLAGDASSYTTGAVIPVDGGRLAVY